MNYNKINRNNLTKVNWRNVMILPEFFNNLSINLLKEVSLVSKYVRLKFKSKLFESIKLDGGSIGNYFLNEHNILCGYFEKEAYESNVGEPDIDSYYNDSENGFDSSQYEDYEIGCPLGELESQLIYLNPFVKKFVLKDVESAGYYLLSLVSSLENLTDLQLSSCTVSLTDFNQIINSLPRLNNIKLEYVKFTEISDHRFNIKDIKFPKCIISLSIFQCEGFISKHLSEAYLFLFHKSNYGAYTYLNFSNFNIPSLRKFAYNSLYIPSSDVNEFLVSNSQLEYLNIQSSKLDQYKFDYFEKFIDLKKLDISLDSAINEQVDIPTLNSIEDISFNYATQESFTIIQMLCTNSPNLRHLRIEFNIGDGIASFIDNILTYAISSCQNLKKLILCIHGRSGEVLDFSKLTNVKALIVKYRCETNTVIDISKVTNLKIIKLYALNGKTMPKAILKNASIIQNWVFKYYVSSIKGVKI